MNIAYIFYINQPLGAFYIIEISTVLDFQADSTDFFWYGNSTFAPSACMVTYWTRDSRACTPDPVPRHGGMGSGNETIKPHLPIVSIGCPV